MELLEYVYIEYEVYINVSNYCWKSQQSIHSMWLKTQNLLLQDLSLKTLSDMTWFIKSK